MTASIPTHFKITPKNAPGVFLDVGRNRFEKYFLNQKLHRFEHVHSDLDLRSAKVVKAGEESQ